MASEEVLRQEIKAIDEERFKIQDAMNMIKQAEGIGAQIQQELEKIKKFEQSNKQAEGIVWHEFFKDELDCPIDEEVLITTSNDEVCIDMLRLDKKNYKMVFYKGVPGEDVIAWANKPTPYKRG